MTLFNWWVGHRLKVLAERSWEKAGHNPSTRRTSALDVCIGASRFLQSETQPESCCRLQNGNFSKPRTQRDRGYKFNMNPSYCSSTLPFVLSVLGKSSRSWQTWRHFFICQPAFGPKLNQHYRSVSALPTDGRFPTLTLLILSPPNVGKLTSLLC